MAKLPKKKRMRDIADRLWSRAIRNDWNNRCVVCGNRTCEAHHLLPRQHESLRYTLENGVALCARCHQFDPHISPHQSASGWLNWLAKHQPRLWQWCDDNTPPPEFTGTKTAQYYCDVIRGLRQYVEPEEFEQIVGVRFSQYLEEDGK